MWHVLAPRNRRSHQQAPKPWKSSGRVEAAILGFHPGAPYLISWGRPPLSQRVALLRPRWVKAVQARFASVWSKQQRDDNARRVDPASGRCSDDSREPGTQVRREEESVRSRALS